MTETKIGQLRIWHFPNLGSRIYFKKEVTSVEEGKATLRLLADYDLKLGDLVSSNAQGMEIYVGKDVNYETSEGWEEWYDDDGNDFNMRKINE